MTPQEFLEALAAEQGIVRMDALPIEQRRELAMRSVMETIALHAVAEAAENVVAQWRGDISRKPMIGKLRDALAEWKRVSTSAKGTDE
jgi:hypothetical protein